MKTFFGLVTVFFLGMGFDHCYVQKPGKLTNDVSAVQKGVSQGAQDAQNRYEQERAAANRPQ